ncbi:hypothetical protein BV25DRAFT_1910318 [Artomyces pyxidatus]|uniref:Uncharacterized protein n=1 Tax=Artomyces pyxidatus TaxID=48021 RepID=A0ACB8TJE8_9AGAM|nr:hypothetical protein BV25DRAFT_1910318 [Artomyces pyxidatus]
MSFQHAPITKGLMMACALTSFVVAIFDVKYYFHLQLDPHLSRHHQYWRLLTHHLVYSNSSELFVWELLLYNIGISIERQFGSTKYGSFVLITTLVSTVLEFLSLLAFHQLGFNYIPAGATTLAFSLLYQYSRLVPVIYQFRVFGVTLSNKIFFYVLAFQLAISQSWSTAVVAAIGTLTGALYRSDIANLKSYRLPPWLIRLSSRFLLPLLGDMRAPHRTNRALPDETIVPTPPPAEEEVVTTARPAAPPPAATEASATAGSGSVVREWVNELTGRGERASAGLRVPSDAEVTQLTNMFPDVDMAAVVGALQRSPNIEGAVETLLSSS